MTTILVRDPYAEKEVIRLSKEFPGCEFILATTDGSLPEEVWSRAEILYGRYMSPEELRFAVRLRWIHVPVPYLNELCMDCIKDRGPLLVTATLYEGSEAVGDFVMGAVLSFAKNLLGWYEATRNQNVFDLPLFEQSIWKMEGITFLQVGLNPAGGAVAKRAVSMGMRVWGVQEIFTFHVDCHKLFTYNELSDLLPAADIICMCPPTIQHLREWISPRQIDQMEEDTILVVIGGRLLLSEEDFSSLAGIKKLRGILIDGHFESPISSQSQLWDIPNLIVCPGISSAPYDVEEASIKLFRKNLRRFLHGEYYEMINVVSGQEALSNLHFPQIGTDSPW